MSRILDAVGQYLAERRGLLPLLGLLLVLLNLLFRIFVPQAWISATDLLLHAGILLAILGFLLARVL